MTGDRQRPQRSRKLVSKHGDDQLHWIEEKALQKALLRSIHEKDSPAKKELKPNSNDESHLQPQTSSIHIVSGQSSDSKPPVGSKDTAAEGQCALRLTRLQSKLLEEAELYKTCKDFDSNEAINETPAHVTTKGQEKSAISSVGCVTPESAGSRIQNIGQNSSSRKKLTFTYDSPASDDCPPNSDEYFKPKPAARLRAQRKFACNAFLPHRSESPVKMNKQKLTDPTWEKPGSDGKRRRSLRDRSRLFPVSTNQDSSTAVKSVVTRTRNSKSREYKLGKTQSQVFEKKPDADLFLNYLCFRNTTVHVELYPKRKR